MESVLDIPIKNLDQAQKYFLAMGCNHFLMSRESFARYDEYRSLNIPKEKEQQWRNEKVKDMLLTFPLETPTKIARYYFELSKIIYNYPNGFEIITELAERAWDITPLKDIQIMLSTIIGDNGKLTHGGLIEYSYRQGRKDLAQRLFKIAEKMILKAMKAGVNLLWVQGYFVDVAESLNLSVDKALLTEFRLWDDKSIYQYYLENANSGKVYSMYMLGKYSAQGKGCIKNIELAKYWLNKAAKAGSKLAKTELAQL